mmetsp:Transcript_10566/g.18142  ORF Transcript_10566/g.18142 Transcript_10566/m.18142 type:complete len:90 (+) Transcript_10566:22-291(+)
MKMVPGVALPGFMAPTLPSANLNRHLFIPINSNHRTYISGKKRYHAISMVHDKQGGEDDPTLLRVSRRRLLLASVAALGISFGANLFVI